MAMTPQQKIDRSTLRNAIAEAIGAGARNLDALKRVLKTTQSGEPPTAAQMRMVNATRARFELPRVSLPVFDREKRREFFERRSQTINSERATLVASRPLRPPCLDPDKMNGAADQFPGSDFGEFES
jgi:hypothetical protein